MEQFRDRAHTTKHQIQLLKNGKRQASLQKLPDFSHPADNSNQDWTLMVDRLFSPTYKRAAPGPNEVDKHRFLWRWRAVTASWLPPASPGSVSPWPSFSDLPAVPLVLPALRLGSENTILSALLRSLEPVQEALQSCYSFHWNFCAIC